MRVFGLSALKRWTRKCHKPGTRLPAAASPTGTGMAMRTMWIGKLFYLLHLNQLVVETPVMHQFVMRPAFHDPALLQHYDLIRMPDRAQAVCDHDTRPVLHHFINSVLYEAFAFGVEG